MGLRDSLQIWKSCTKHPISLLILVSKAMLISLFNISFTLPFCTLLHGIVLSGHSVVSFNLLVTFLFLALLTCTADLTGDLWHITRMSGTLYVVGVKVASEIFISKGLCFAVGQGDKLGRTLHSPIKLSLCHSNP